MVEKNQKFPKLVRRDREGGTVAIGPMVGKVEFSGEWSEVNGSKGVSCRTWTVKGVDMNLVDGADINIERGGHTPIQEVNVAELVVDIPERGRGYVCVMDTDGQVYVNYFDGSEEFQMVWTKEMLICWVAETRMELTEFESPAFTDEMFTTVSDDVTQWKGRDIANYRNIVFKLRQSVEGQN